MLYFVVIFGYLAILDIIPQVTLDGEIYIYTPFGMFLKAN